MSIRRAAVFSEVGALFLCSALAWPVLASPSAAQKPGAAKSAAARSSAQKLARPKLVVMVVVDQMRGDYVDKFQFQWSGGLKRLVREGAWFHDAAYPYAATETCVGHATISTGALPADHGMVANAWWDRDSQKMTTCTADPKAKNEDYGGSASGGESAWRLSVPSFAEELRFQRGDDTRIVTFSLKARAAITMAGHRATAVTWLDSGKGLWQTSDVYGIVPFIADYVKAHPIKADYGKTWTLSLPEKDYLYSKNSPGAGPPAGWEPVFPHPLRGKAAGAEPDAAFYEQWNTSPFADTYLTHLAETAVDKLSLGQGPGTDFLGVSYSSPDYVGHAFGPRSWEIQDVLARLDRDMGDLFAHLDAKVGKGNYVVALSADHGVAPVPEQMEKAGVDAGFLNLADVQAAIEKALEPLNYPHPAVARVASADVYFAPGVYARLEKDHDAMRAVLDAARSVPGVREVFRAEQLARRPATENPFRSAESLSYFASRSGDLLIVPKPYWLLDWTPAGKERSYGTGHGTPYFYDQHVPVLFMGFGIKPGEYFGASTPADIAPTLAALCGITLSTRDGHALSQALSSASH